jgi:hypothetical protein
MNADKAFERESHHALTLRNHLVDTFVHYR